jgi:hypothetical protein
MIDLRLDGGFNADLPPDKAETLKRENGAAWNTTEKAQRDINAYLGTLRTEVLKATTAAEGAEQYLVGRMTPEVHLKKIAEITTRLQTIEGGTLGKYGLKIGETRVKQKDWATKAANDSNLRTGLMKQWTDLKSEHEFALSQTAQQLAEMGEIEKRLKGIPRDDKRVQVGVTGAVDVMNRVRKLAQDYTTQGGLLVKELQAYISAPMPTSTQAKPLPVRPKPT